ncbi:MAG: DUF748 domain-containing protein [Burkholderiales bacterium]
MSASSPPSPLHRWIRRGAIAVAALLLLIVVSWLAVPPLARWQIETRLTEALGRPVTVKEVAFDPFRLEVTLHNLAIGDAEGQPPLLTIDQLAANVSSASLYHRAPVLDAIKVTHPVAALRRDAKGEYSVHDIVDRLSARTDEAPARFSLNNIEVVDAALTFEDGVTSRKHTIESLGIGIPFLSTLPYQTDIEVKPHLDGRFNGSHFALAGNTVPFAQRREATLDIDLDALPLAQYVVYLPRKPAFVLADGALTTHLQVAFVEGGASERRLEVRGRAELANLAIKRRDGTPLVAATKLALEIERVDVLARDVRIASLVASSPSADVRQLADGHIELAQPLFEDAANAKAAAADATWSVAIAKASIADGALTLSDDTTRFQTALADVTAEASNLSTKKGEKARVTLSFVSADRIASFKGEAEVDPTAPAASGTFDLKKFSLPLLFPYYKDVLAVEVKSGSIDYASSFTLAANGDLRLGSGNATIAALELTFPGADEPLWRVPQLTARNVDVDTSARRVTIDDVRAQSGTLRIARDRDGTLEAARLMKTTNATGTAADTQTWTLVGKRLAFERIALRVEDRVPEPSVKLSGSDITAVVTDFSNARNSKAALSLSGRIGERGSIRFAGPLATNPFSIAGDLDASGLDLVPLKPYVEPHVNVTLVSGALSAKGRLAVDVPEGADATAAWNGDVSVTDFAALDRPTASDLARWKRLALEGAEVSTSPPRFTVARIAAEDYFARLIVYQDGTINFARLMTPGDAPEAAPAKARQDAGAAPVPFPISIGRIDLARGNLNVSDFFVKPNYAANLTDVTGTIGTMSAQSPGTIELAARVDRTAPVEIRGTIQPFAKDIALDLTATARDVDLPPLTPYSVKYAGYGIEKGKLTFDVHYRIEARKLAAENRLVLDQLTFNRERIDSPTATKLPVLLAVALLKDSRGVIDVQLPISGSLDDPQFSMWGLIVQVIANLIGKAATAPFTLLTAAFGGHGEELSVVPFDAGTSEIGGDAQKRIDTLGKALADRPGLRLEIAGCADPASDREAMRRDAVETAMKREKMKRLARDGTAPASLSLVTIEPAERERWLKAAYEEAPIEGRPRNFVGMLKDAPAADMEAMLLAHAKVDDDAIRLLANARAQAVKDALAAKGVAGDRVFLLAPRVGSKLPTSAPANAPPARVDLALR